LVVRDGGVSGFEVNLLDQLQPRQRGQDVREAEAEEKEKLWQEQPLPQGKIWRVREQAWERGKRMVAQALIEPGQQTWEQRSWSWSGEVLERLKQKKRQGPV
jgi:hypothetical protein